MLFFLFYLLEFDSSPAKRIHPDISCLLDLPDEILLIICGYLSSADILFSFYTPSKPEFRLHRMSYEYHKKIRIDGITKTQFNYLLKLFSDCEISLRPESLILSNEHVTCLIDAYFTIVHEDVIQSMFVNLTSLTLVDCFHRDIQHLNDYIKHLTKLEFLHITIRKPDDCNRNMFIKKIQLIEECILILFRYGIS